MYSQKAEESYIARAVGDTGHFLDIGAYDGYHYSNTMALVDRGWTGVMVEPGLEAFQALLKEHGDNDKLTLIHAAVGTRTEPLVRFWNNPTTFSTTEASNRDRFICEGFLPSFWVPIIDLVTIYERFGPFDMVSIDTEGTSRFLMLHLLCALAHTIWPTVICVEHDGEKDFCRRAAESRGYITLMENEENLIFKKGA